MSVTAYLREGAEACEKLSYELIVRSYGLAIVGNKGEYQCAYMIDYIELERCKVNPILPAIKMVKERLDNHNA